MDLQNVQFLRTYALAHAATELCRDLCNYSWSNSEQLFMSNLKPLAQAGTCSYSYIFDIQL